MGVTRRRVMKAGVAAAAVTGLTGGLGAAAHGAAAENNDLERSSGMVEMRSRYLTTLNNYEVSDYLKRNDVIFIPVGTVEMHGVMPLGCEYVLPLGFAVKMAERVDGLVLPHMVYFYPGATAIGQGTVSVSPSAGAAYLRAVCESLLRQGFRRQVLLTAHGPASVTVMPMVREFYDDTKCPIVYMDLNTQFGRAQETIGEVDFNKVIWGAYSITGQLDDIITEPAGIKRAAKPEAAIKLQKEKAYAGFMFSEVSHHGWFPAKSLTQEEREKRTAEGLAQIDGVIAAMDLPGMLDAMRAHDKFTAEDIVGRYGQRLR